MKDPLGTDLGGRDAFVRWISTVTGLGSEGRQGSNVTFEAAA